MHVLLEVSPMPEEGTSDELLLRRLRALYREGEVLEAAEELATAQRDVVAGLAAEEKVEKIRQRHIASVVRSTVHISVIDPSTKADMNEVILKADRRRRLRYTPE